MSDHGPRLEMSTSAIVGEVRGEMIRFAGGTFRLENGAAMAYRDRAQCPPEDSEQGALWPRRPHLLQRAIFWWAEQVASFWGNGEQASAFRETRNLWRRHPWQRAGDLWWRPWWIGGDPKAVGTYETIDPTSGLHRWNFEYEQVNDFMFNTEAYYIAVLRRNL